MAPIEAPMAMSAPGTTSSPGTKSKKLAGSARPNAVQNIAPMLASAMTMPTTFAQVPNRQTRKAATHGTTTSERKNGRSSATSTPQMSEAATIRKAARPTMNRPSVASRVQRGFAVVSFAVGSVSSIVRPPRGRSPGA